MSSPRLATGRFSERDRIYSLTTICHRRQPLFLNISAVDVVADELQRLAVDGIADHLAWVLMPDHLHWLFHLRDGSLAQCMQLLKGRSARSINRCSSNHGAVWQAGYFDHALRHDDCVLRHARYILENPVRAGLVRTFDDYAHAWSAAQIRGEFGR